MGTEKSLKMQQKPLHSKVKSQYDDHVKALKGFLNKYFESSNSVLMKMEVYKTPFHSVSSWPLDDYYQAGIHLFILNNGSIRTMCEIDNNNDTRTTSLTLFLASFFMTWFIYLRVFQKFSHA